MKLILNGLNGEYLRSVTELAADETDRVDAAVAYATEAALLFEWCWNKNILLRYWGRFDETVPVSLPILKSFLSRKSPNFTCKLIRNFHAKVIWWRGYGAYIGSANLTGSAWYNNIEAGVFFDETELASSGHDLELEQFFATVDKHSSPLTEELVQLIEKRARELHEARVRDQSAAGAFASNHYIPQWSGLAAASTQTANHLRKEAFLKEWNSTLQILRDLADRVSLDENRPAWVDRNTPKGAQADQFLHAHYYQRTFSKDRKAQYEQYYERNRSNPNLAVSEAIGWWHKLSEAPGSELVTLSEWGPYLRQRLDKQTVLNLSESELIEICARVHAIRDHARRVSNVELSLAPNRKYSNDEKVAALAKYLWGRRSGNGETIAQLIGWVMYGGVQNELPERLWQAVTDPDRRIDHFGVSALGELVGWALPDRFPPRNGRTSKSLRSLGYDVAVHSD